MTASPILFSGEMVRALLAGRKTQTRRVVTGQQAWGPYIVGVRRLDGETFRCEGKEPIPAALFGNDVTFVDVRCPYGQPGDLLWVRETWFQEYDDATARPYEPPRAIYRATEDKEVVELDDDGFVETNKDGTLRSPWRPSIHMPRWASRLTLLVAEVRVERVQEISEADAMHEGVPFTGLPQGSTPDPLHRSQFADLWDSINAARGYGWDRNPWVWVISFSVVQANVDALRKDAT